MRQFFKKYIYKIYIFFKNCLKTIYIYIRKISNDKTIIYNSIIQKPIIVKLNSILKKYPIILKIVLFIIHILVIYYFILLIIYYWNNPVEFFILCEDLKHFIIEIIKILQKTSYYYNKYMNIYLYYKEIYIKILNYFIIFFNWLKNFFWESTELINCKNEKYWKGSDVPTKGIKYLKAPEENISKGLKIKRTKKINDLKKKNKKDQKDIWYDDGIKYLKGPEENISKWSEEKYSTRRTFIPIFILIPINYNNVKLLKVPKCYNGVKYLKAPEEPDLYTRIRIYLILKMGYAFDNNLKNIENIIKNDEICKQNSIFYKVCLYNYKCIKYAMPQNLYKDFKKYRYDAFFFKIFSKIYIDQVIIKFINKNLSRSIDSKTGEYNEDIKLMFSHIYELIYADIDYIFLKHKNWNDDQILNLLIFYFKKYKFRGILIEYEIILNYKDV